MHNVCRCDTDQTLWYADSPIQQIFLHIRILVLSILTRMKKLHTWTSRALLTSWEILLPVNCRVTRKIGEMVVSVFCFLFFSRGRGGIVPVKALKLRLPAVHPAASACCCSGIVTATTVTTTTPSNASAATTAIVAPGRARIVHETDKKVQALGAIRTRDLRFTKPSLCQAELLGQNRCNFSS